jgi:hypothetical protein
MAIIQDPLIRELRGRVGDFVFRRGPNGTTIVAARPDRSRVKPSEAQLAQQRRFAAATSFARAALADPRRRLRYEKLGRRYKLTAYQAAVREYLRTK